MTAPQRVIAILARSPVAGPVKTRLRPVLSARQCSALHIAMTRHVVAQAAAVSGARVDLWLDGDPGEFAALVETFGCQLRQQVAGDLGDRMSAIAREAITAGQHLVLLGADCPLLQNMALEAMFLALARGADAVITPALDGGYVALALARFSPVLFDNKRWGTDGIADATIADFCRLGWDYEVGAAVPDIDRPDDLKRLSGIPALAAFAQLGP